MEKFVPATNVNVSHHIPEDLTFSILSKLPLKSLKRFGCVRKSWVLLFENLHFLKMYRNYFLSNNHSDDNDTSILLNTTINPIPGEEFHSTLYLISGERFENKVKLDWPPPFHENDTWIYILGSISVNGTLCLAQEHGRDIKCVLWKPVTKEFKVIPPSPFLSQSPYYDHLVQSHGFGYDHVRDDYKVIRKLNFFQNTQDEQLLWDEFDLWNPNFNPQPMWEIYSLRSNSWRKLDVEMSSCSAEDGMYNDGMCHWWSITSQPSLVSFDLCNEVVCTTPIPSDMIEHERFDMLHLTLLNGYIAFIIYDEKTTFNIRILGELGVKESWTKVFIVEPIPYIEHPIGIWKTGDIFFRKYDDELVWFDMSTMMIEELGIKGREHCCCIIIYKESLLKIGGF